LFAGCKDQIPTAQQMPLDLAPNYSATLSPSLQGLDTPHQCETLVLGERGALQYRSTRISLHYPQGIVRKANGKTRTFVYRRFDEDGVLLRQARCVLPDAPGARELAIARFRFGGDPRLLSGNAQARGGAGSSFPVGQTPGFSVSRSPDGESPPDCEEYRCYGDYEEIVVPGECTDGKSRGSDGVCYCDNGSDQPDCWLNPDDPENPPGGCDPAFDSCGGGGGGDDTYFDDENWDCHTTPECVLREPEPSEASAISSAIQQIKEHNPVCQDIKATAIAVNQNGSMIWDNRIKDEHNRTILADIHWDHHRNVFVFHFWRDGIDAKTVAHEAMHAMGWLHGGTYHGRSMREWESECT
jgi:hypothetical protein